MRKLSYRAKVRTGEIFVIGSFAVVQIRQSSIPIYVISLIWYIIVMTPRVFRYFGRCPITIIVATNVLDLPRVWKLIYGKKALKALIVYGGFALFLVFSLIYHKNKHI